jgi:hypothetical protein
MRFFRGRLHPAGSDFGRNLSDNDTARLAIASRYVVLTTDIEL